MIVGKFLLVIVLLTALVRAGDDQLLKIGQKHSCIKQVISVFVANKNCNTLDDVAKFNLALKMTECLLQQMGKVLPVECQKNPSSSCRLEGDAWNTFSTFYAHIDNLCHFYWEMLHHQRAELLIGKLSQSSHNAQLLLKKNTVETEKILIIQQTMHDSLEESLHNQREMTILINNSAKHISNLTFQMESFVKRIHQDINENYGSVRNILNAMNDALAQALSIQSYMTAQLSSIRGTLYFFTHFMLLLFVTSIKRYAHARMSCLGVLGVNFMLQVIAGALIEDFLGTDRIRYLFILLELVLVWGSDNKKNQFQEALSVHLNTPRLKDLLRRAIVQNQNIADRWQRLNSYKQNNNHLLPKVMQASLKKEEETN